MTRRDFLQAIAAAPLSLKRWQAGAPGGPLRLTDVTGTAGIAFRHTNGAYGGKLLPETLGSGCAFLDYDADGWVDILLINGSSWPGHHQKRTTLALYRNNRNGTFTDVTRRAGLDVEMYGMGVAVGDYDNDGFPDIYVTAVGQNRLFRNTGKGTFVDVTEKSGLGARSAFSTSALWFDYDRDGKLDLFVCNYVKWSPEHDVFCSVDGQRKAYCTPEAYRGDTCWLFHNRGDGTFEDVTGTSGVFDTSSKSLGVVAFDYDRDGWPDLFVTNDTQANKLYKNLHNGRFRELALEAGVAFSADGKARAGMGVDVGDFDGSGHFGLAVTNFENEMIGLYREVRPGRYEDVSVPAGVGQPSRHTLGFGCVFADLDLDGWLDLIVANGHIDEPVRGMRGTVGYAQPPQLFLNQGRGAFTDIAGTAGQSFAAPKIARGLAYGDFDRDGDVDVMMTTNNGPARLFRNDQAGNRSIRFRLRGTASNRDAIGAVVRIEHAGAAQTQLVKSGSSYLSQSELPLTFGLGRRDAIDRAIVTWPGGRVEDYTSLRAGRAYECVEGEGISPLDHF